MAETAVNTYATTGANAAAGSPNAVAVVNDGTGVRQIVVAGDPTTPANLQTITATGAAKVDGSGVTQPISGTATVTQATGTNLHTVVDSLSGNVAVTAASLPLPTGAATAAKQPALGTAGAASADVLSVQGVASMTALKVDPSGVTSPVSGTVTANAGTNLNTSALALDATLTGGTQKTKLVDTGGTNVGSISAAGALKVDGSAVTQPVSLATNQPTLQAGSAIIGKVTTDQTTHGTTDLVAADITKIAGTAVDTNSGAKSAGTQRVVLATDQPSLTNAQPIKGGTLEAAGLSAGSLNAFLIASTDVSAYKSWSLQVSGTWSGNLTFLGSNDNVTFYSVQAVNMNNSTSTQTTTTTSSNGLFSGTIGFRYLAVQMTSYSSGTATGVAEYYAVANPNHYMGVGAAQYGNWQTQLTDGTNTANVLKSDGTAAGQNAMQVAGARQEIAINTSATGAQILASIDSTGYRYGVIQLSAVGVGLAFTAQVCNDNATWVTIPTRNITTTGNAWTNAALGGATGMFEVLIPGRYFRLNVTAQTSGTTTGAVDFFTQTAMVNSGTANVGQINGATPLMGNGVTGTGSQRVTIASDNTVLPGVGAGATGSAVPANAAYTGLVGLTANPTAATTGNLIGAMADKLGRQIVNLGAVRDLRGKQTTTISASTSETTIVTAVASTFLDLVALVVSNTSATAARLDIRDTTAGTVLFSLYVPAGDTRGFTLTGSSIPQTTVNTSWTAQSSASVTDLRILAIFEKNI